MFDWVLFQRRTQDSSLLHKEYRSLADGAAEQPYSFEGRIITLSVDPGSDHLVASIDHSKSQRKSGIKNLVTNFLTKWRGHPFRRQGLENATASDWAVIEKSNGTLRLRGNVSHAKYGSHIDLMVDLIGRETKTDPIRTHPMATGIEISIASKGANRQHSFVLHLLDPTDPNKTLKATTPMDTVVRENPDGTETFVLDWTAFVLEDGTSVLKKWNSLGEASIQEMGVRTKIAVDSPDAISVQQKLDLRITDNISFLTDPVKWAAYRQVMIPKMDAQQIFAETKRTFEYLSSEQRKQMLGDLMDAFHRLDPEYRIQPIDPDIFGPYTDGSPISHKDLEIFMERYDSKSSDTVPLIQWFFADERMQDLLRSGPIIEKFRALLMVQPRLFVNRFATGLARFKSSKASRRVGWLVDQKALAAVTERLNDTEIHQYYMEVLQEKGVQEIISRVEALGFTVKLQTKIQDPSDVWREVGMNPGELKKMKLGRSIILFDLAESSHFPVAHLLQLLVMSHKAEAEEMDLIHLMFYQMFLESTNFMHIWHMFFDGAGSTAGNAPHYWTQLAEKMAIDSQQFFDAASKLK